MMAWNNSEDLLNRSRQFVFEIPNALFRPTNEEPEVKYSTALLKSLISKKEIRAASRAASNGILSEHFF